MSNATAEVGLDADSITFTAAAREDTGAHFLDSGGVYGRHHEREPVDPNGPAVVLDVDEIRSGYMESTATIETGRYLDNWFRIDRERQANVDAAADASRDSWFDIGTRVMERAGFSRAERGNVYNGENDLSQVYVWEIWRAPGYTGDPWYAGRGDVKTVVYLHTGCDVRGGYGRPIICDSRGEYSLPPSPVVGVHGIRGLDANGVPLSRRQVHGIAERWSVGYSRAPLYEFAGDVERVFGFTADPDSRTVVVRTTDGDILKVHFYAEGPGGTLL